MDPDKYWAMMRDLDESYEQMMKGQRIMTEIEVEVTALTKALISKHYTDEIEHLSAKGTRNLTARFEETQQHREDISRVMHKHTVLIRHVLE